jgi:outer membrane protein assembly factor BamB
MRFRLLVLLAVGGLAGLGACGGKDAVEPPAELVAFEPTLPVQLVWKQKVGSGSERLRLGLAPVSDGMRIFAGGHDGTASAFGLADGEVLWSTETDLPLAGGPGVGNGMVVFGTSDGKLVALDAETGEIRWERLVGSEVIAPPAIAGDVIAFRSVDGRLSVVSAQDGEEVWSVLQAMPSLTLRGNSGPFVIGETVVAGFDNGRVGAYDIDDGSSRWEIQLSNPSGRSEIERLVDVGVDIEVFGSEVYAVNFQGEAVAIDMASGVVFWSRDLSSYTGLGVDSDHVYVTDDVSAIVALDRSNGTDVAWRQDALRLRDVTAATRYRETVVVGDYDGYVHWLSAEDGHFLAREHAASTRISAKPLAIGPMVFVQADDGTISAFRIVDESG